MKWCTVEEIVKAKLGNACGKQNIALNKENDNTKSNRNNSDSGQRMLNKQLWDCYYY